MPSHQHRREPLPRHYQFGDAAGMTPRPGQMNERWIVEEEQRIVKLLRDKRRLLEDRTA